MIVEDSGEDSSLQLKGLHSNGYTQIYQRVVTVEDLVIALKKESWDIVIVDINHTQFSEQSVLSIIRDNDIVLPCLILSEKSGETRTVQTINYGKKHEDNQPRTGTFIPSISNDIQGAMLNNMHLQSDKNYRDQKEWFRVTLSSIGDAVITTDINSIITFMNPVAEELTGYLLADAMGKPISQVFRIFNEITLGPAEIPVDRVIREGFIIGLANHTGLISKNGETRSIADSAAPIRNDDNDIIGVVMVFRDITDTKQMEEDMARLDKLNVVGQMAASIAHEIRNPMTTVRGFLQLLKINKEFNEYTDNFEIMINELDRANSIITGFLSLAKEKTAELNEEPLNGIINTIAPLIHAEALMNNKFVKLELGDVPTLPLNQNEIRQLILNLVRNALDASTPGNGVILRTAFKEGKVVLSVQDKGKGIAEDMLAKLGTPFLTTKDNGTGLGLTICYGIAEKHGANIEVESGDDGTTFSVYFNEMIDQSA
ncbi:MAG: ATP-binding protein [Ignavibacteriales bacterium]